MDDIRDHNEINQETEPAEGVGGTLDFSPPVAAGPALIEADPVAVGNAGTQVGGIDILVQMASKGEIDPKNIDIIDVTDKFLRAIAAAPKENLRQSGKILFHASVLLRMKAEALLAITIDDGDDFLDFDEDGSPLIFDSRHEPIARQITLQDLERALVRRSTTRQIRQRKVTLEQLIEALKEAEHVERERVQKKVQPRIDLEGHHEVHGMDDILELAHEEDIEVVIQRVDEILHDSIRLGDMVSLLELIKYLGARGDWVDAFLAVLFLSNAGKVTLEQEEFYGPLYVVRPAGAAVAGAAQPASA